MDDVFNALLAGVGSLSLAAAAVNQIELFRKEIPQQQDHARIAAFYFTAVFAYTAAGREGIAQTLFLLAVVAVAQMSAARRDGGRS